MNDLIEINNSSIELAPNYQITNNLLEKFISFIDASPKTVETYQRQLKQFFKYLSINNITQPTRDNVLSFREYLKADHKAATIQGYITVVKIFFRWTSSENIYPNISENIKSVKLSKSHKKDYLTSAQAKRLLFKINRTTLKGKRDYAIISIMLTCGLRDIEIARADIQDIRTVGDNTVLFIHGKGKEDKNEYVKLAAPVEEALHDYMTELKISNSLSPLFVSLSNHNKNGRMTTRSISRIVKNLLISAGFNSDRLTAHSLRHTAGTLNLLNGGSLEETQQLLRHSNINTTMIYLHHIERDKNNSEKRIADAIFSNCL